MVKGVDDLALLEAWRAGDRDAGEVLFDRHFLTVACFFRNKVSNELEDLVQRTFLQCVESKDRFRAESSFRTYLLSIANNVLRNHFRRRSRKEGRLDFGSVSIHELAPQPSSVLASRREHQLLIEGLRQLPLQSQVILELYYWEELTAPQIADVVDAPVGTVRTRLRLAKEKLRRIIEELAREANLVSSNEQDLERWASEVRDQLREGS